MVLPPARIPVSQLPTTLIGLDRWLRELWEDKERMLANFHGERQQEDNHEDGANPSPPQFLFPTTPGMQLRGRTRGLMPMQILALVSEYVHRREGPFTTALKAS